MQLVGESKTPDTPQTLSSLISQTTQNPAIPTTTPKPSGEYVHRAAWKAGVMGALNALFVILAVRAILLVAVVGAIYLAIIVVAAPDPWRLGALAVYAIAVVLPTVWLTARQGR